MAATKASHGIRPNAYLRATPIFVDGVLYAQDAHGLVVAIDGETGKTIWEQQLQASTREEAIGNPTRGVDYWRGGAGNVGAGDGGNRKEAAPEDVRGFDAQTGKLLWTFHVVPRSGEFGTDTWGNDSWKIAGDLGAWNPMTTNEEPGYVFIPLTSPTAAWYGGWRPGDNLFANTLVALDAKTGRRVWHFQTIHHDLWDWDNIGPPMLGEITVDGRRIKAVMQANKAAFLYVLDRTNGRPVWPIEERPVPQSTVPGEHSSPTQPFPTRPPEAFDLQGLTDNDLIDYTPERKARARNIAKTYVMGPVFTPPSVPSDEPGGKKGTLVQPGAWGSANWNTGAFDPETVWMTPNGDGPRNHPLLRNVNLPPLGIPNRPAPLVTKTLLFLEEGSNAVSGTSDLDWTWGRKFRAYDKANRRVIWETELPSGTTAGPMTYVLRGKQHTLVSIGSKDPRPSL